MEFLLVGESIEYIHVVIRLSLVCLVLARLFAVFCKEVFGTNGPVLGPGPFVLFLQKVKFTNGTQMARLCGPFVHRKDRPKARSNRCRISRKISRNRALRTPVLRLISDD